MHYVLILMRLNSCLFIVICFMQICVRCLCVLICFICISVCFICVIYIFVISFSLVICISVVICTFSCHLYLSCHLCLSCHPCVCLVTCASLVICVSLVIRMHLWRARWARARARALSYGQELFSKTHPWKSNMPQNNNMSISRLPGTKLQISCLQPKWLSLQEPYQNSVHISVPHGPRSFCSTWYLW